MYAKVDTRLKMIALMEEEVRNMLLQHQVTEVFRCEKEMRLASKRARVVDFFLSRCVLFTVYWDVTDTYFNVGCCGTFERRTSRKSTTVLLSLSLCVSMYLCLYVSVFLSLYRALYVSVFMYLSVSLIHTTLAIILFHLFLCQC